MSIQFKATQLVNPQEPDAEKKFYARAVSTGEIRLKQMSQRISAMSTVNSGDILAALDLLLQVMREELAAGRVVRLGEFGSFSVSVSSEGVPTAEELSSSSIKSSRLNFRPGEDLQNMLKTLHYQKIASEKTSESAA